jgi:hypothetical protein
MERGHFRLQARTINIKPLISSRVASKRILHNIILLTHPFTKHPSLVHRQKEAMRALLILKENFPKKKRFQKIVNCTFHLLFGAEFDDKIWVGSVWDSKNILKRVCSKRNVCYILTLHTKHLLNLILFSYFLERITCV